MLLQEALKQIINQPLLGMYRPGRYIYPIYEECGYCYYDHLNYKSRMKMNFNNEDILADNWEVIGISIKYIGKESFRRPISKLA